MLAVNGQSRRIYPQKNENPIKKVIALPTKEGFRLVKLSEILYCKAEGNYTRIFFIKGEKLLISRKLKETAASFAETYFQRIHQSYLVNMEEAHLYLKKSGGRLVMSDGTNLPISKSYKKQVLELFKFV